MWPRTEARYGGLLYNAPARSWRRFVEDFKELRPHVETLRRRRPFSCGRLFASGLNMLEYDLLFGLGADSGCQGEIS